MTRVLVKFKQAMTGNIRNPESVLFRAGRPDGEVLDFNAKDNDCDKFVESGQDYVLVIQCVGSEDAKMTVTGTAVASDKEVFRPLVARINTYGAVGRGERHFTGP